MGGRNQELGPCAAFPGALSGIRIISGTTVMNKLGPVYDNYVACSSLTHSTKMMDVMGLNDVGRVKLILKNSYN